jgi:hypothetical protein
VAVVVVLEAVAVHLELEVLAVVEQVAPMEVTAHRGLLILAVVVAVAVLGLQQ